MIAIALVTAGCQRPLKPIFEETHPQIVWPSDGQPARIRYVGQISTSADLRPAPKPFEGLGGLLLGSKEPDRLNGPRSAVRSRDGRYVWVADPGWRCVHLFDLQRRQHRRITHVGDAALLTPVDVCVGPGSAVYVCDSEEGAVYRVSPENGGSDSALALPDDVQRPVSVFWDDAVGELYVVDVLAHDVKVLTADGRPVRTLGRRGGGAGEFNFPCDLVVAGEDVWVVDAGNHRVQRLSRLAAPQAAFGQAGDAFGDLALPKAIALDRDGHVYVVDARFENVQIFDRQGRLLLTFGEEGTGPGQFWLPGGIFIDDTDRIWICDSYNQRLQVFDYVPDASQPPQTEP
ncbi:MAG: 6-bladed beta-propeller [Phycisphaerales bacterium]|nr:MAG: 6-bladed beta-propeller [Phycisphaerales bacterium]